MYSNALPASVKIALMRRTRWSLDDLHAAVTTSSSYRELLNSLGLRPAGGNYATIRKHLASAGLTTDHFLQRPWNRGLRVDRRAVHSIDEILRKGSEYQSFKLKRRLIAAGLKDARCEACGWAERAPDGRVPLELHHVNGQRDDNRLENLRVLCPNCHSLQPTHRGLNKRRSSI